MKSRRKGTKKNKRTRKKRGGNKHNIRYYDVDEDGNVIPKNTVMKIGKLYKITYEHDRRVVAGQFTEYFPIHLPGGWIGREKIKIKRGPPNNNELVLETQTIKEIIEIEEPKAPVKNPEDKRMPPKEGVVGRKLFGGRKKRGGAPTPLTHFIVKGHQHHINDFLTNMRERQVDGLFNENQHPDDNDEHGIPDRLGNLINDLELEVADDEGGYFFIIYDINADMRRGQGGTGYFDFHYISLTQVQTRIATFHIPDENIFPSNRFDLFREENIVNTGSNERYSPRSVMDTLGGGRRKKKTRKYKGNKYPYKNITKKEAIADFIKLKTTTNPRSLNGLEIVNYGTEKLRVRTKYRGKSLIERWKDKKARKTLKKFANRLYKGSYTDDLLHAYRSAIALSWGTLSSMRTSAALQMYRKYNAKKVLDFTAGWGSRMTAALAADIDYIGIDTNKSLKKGYNKIIKTVKKHTKSKVKLFFQPAETVDYSKLDYDFVFTSPPYEYLELYEHMKNYEGTKKIKQAYSANDTKRKNDGFYDTFLIPTIKDIYKHLPKGKWICLNVPDLMYDKIKKKWKACDKKEDYMISKRVGSVMKAADRRGQEFVYCWKKK